MRACVQALIIICTYDYQSYVLCVCCYDLCDLHFSIKTVSYIYIYIQLLVMYTVLKAWLDHTIFGVCV